MTTDADRDPELFEALAAAYALVATADLEVPEVEISRFQGWARDVGFGARDAERLCERCRTLAARLLGDRPGRAEALERVASIKGGGKRASLVLGAARVAVVADARLEEVEEIALREVATALGMDPDAA